MTALSDYLLEQARHRQGLSDREIARRCDMTHVAIGKILSGRSNPSEETLEKLANGLKLPLRVLRDKADLTDPLPRFELPMEASRLRPGQRQAVLGVVRAFLRDLDEIEGAASTGSSTAPRGAESDGVVTPFPQADRSPRASKRRSKEDRRS